MSIAYLTAESYSAAIDDGIIFRAFVVEGESESGGGDDGYEKEENDLLNI